MTLPEGKDFVSFNPVALKTNLPDASKQAWPMGDVLSMEPLLHGPDMGKVKQAVDAAFDPPDAKNLIVFSWNGKKVRPQVRSQWIKVYTKAAQSH